MLSYSVSQTKWRITTEAENSARGSAFVFCYGDCHRRNCRRSCTTGASFARADRTYNAAPNAKEKALSLTLSETTLQANVGSRLYAVRKEQTQNQPPASPAAGSPEILRSTLA